MPRRPRLLIINASLAGDDGNTALALARAHRALGRHSTAETLTLATALPPDAATLPPTIQQALGRADGFMFGTGTHWDSWSSVLQRFLEVATITEGTSLWLGKPAAVVITEHSVGGKGVLSRLQGILVTLGCAVPPMSGLVLSRAVLLAAEKNAGAARDFWSRADLAIVCHNLTEAARVRLPGARPAVPRWRAWSVDRTDFHGRWLDR